MQQFKIALILVVCGLYGSSVAAAGCSDDGYYVVEEDCSRYYQCVDQLRHDFTCSEGLKFDTNTFNCVWPEKANCKNSGVKQTTSKPNTTKKPSEPTKECPKGDGFFVEDGDCTRFYACADGVRHYYTCPTGQKFDTVSKNCVLPENAKCTN